MEKKNVVVGKITPIATVMLQISAEVETKVILLDDTLYFPAIPVGDLLGAGGFEPSKEEKAPKTEKKKPVKTEELEEEDHEEEEKSEKTSRVKYTEAELQEIDTKELEKMLKAMGVNPEDYEGKNTNKKLRLLVISAQNGELEADEEAEAEEIEEAPKGKKAETSKRGKKSDPEEDEEESGGITEEKVTDLLAALDSGTINATKLQSKIMELTDNKDAAEAVGSIISDFLSDTDLEPEEVAKDIVKACNGKTEKKVKRGAKETKEKFVEAGDLKVGDKVSVYWEEEEEWFEGEVTTIKRGKVNIAYEDDTEAILDENNTKIKLV